MRKFLAGLAAGALALCAGYALASRNSSGTMSAANGPYISGTTISSTIVNARFADIENELTDSLSRSGKGGMTAPLKEADGTVAAPSFSFTNEPGTGLYRIGASDLGLAVNGSKKHEWTGSGETVTGTFSVSGVLSMPGGFDSPGSGIFDANITVIGSSSLGVTTATSVGAVGGVTGATVTATGLLSGGTLGVTGTTNLSGAANLTGATTLGASGTAIANLTKGTCLLNGGSPATCTASVPTGSDCVCTLKSGGTAHIVGCAVSGTTLTAISGTGADVNNVSYFCWN